MKNAIITSALMLLSIGTALKAQDARTYPREKLSFGIKAGINYSNVWDEEGQDFRADPKTGFAGGVFLGIPIGPFMGFQPEVLISQKGFQGSGTLLGSPYSFSKTTTYIDVPLQFQLKPVPHFALVLGPQYSYLVHERNEYILGSSSVVEELEFENNNIRKNILGFVAGADITVSRLLIAPRLGWDIVANNGDGSSSTPRYKNRWLQLTLGVKM